jgi:hypothetical protein
MNHDVAVNEEDEDLDEDRVKVEVEDLAHAPTSDSMGIPHRRRTMDSVVEEDEEDD